MKLQILRCLPAHRGGEQDVKKHSKVVGKEIGVSKPQPRGQIQTHICFHVVCGRLRAVPAELSVDSREHTGQKYLLSYPFTDGGKRKHLG